MMTTSELHRPDRRRGASLAFLVAAILVHELYPPDRQARRRDPNFGPGGTVSDPWDSEVTRKTFRLHSLRAALRAFVRE